MVGRKKEEGRRKKAAALVSRVIAGGILFPAFFLLPPAFFLLTPAAQESPLPDPSALFNATRENLARAGRVQDEFAYRERRTQVHMNPFGRLGTGGTIVYEI